MRSGLGLLGALVIAWPHSATAQASWTTDAYEPRPPMVQPQPSPAARPIEPQPKRPQPGAPHAGYWEGRWEGRWIPSPPPPPVYAAPYAPTYAPQPAYVEDYPPAPPPRRYRQERQAYGDNWSSVSNSASANVVIQTAPMTFTTTETVTEYVVEDSSRLVRRAVPVKPKRRIAKKPYCLCRLAYR